MYKFDHRNVMSLSYYHYHSSLTPISYRIVLIIITHHSLIIHHSLVSYRIVSYRIVSYRVKMGLGLGLGYLTSALLSLIIHHSLSFISYLIVLIIITHHSFLSYLILSYLNWTGTFSRQNTIKYNYNKSRYN